MGSVLWALFGVGIELVCRGSGLGLHTKRPLVRSVELGNTVLPNELPGVFRQVGRYQEWTRLP